MILTLGGMIGTQRKSEAYVDRLRESVDQLRLATVNLPRRPRVYFEEWDEPRISCIRWVSELVAIAGGDDCFPELATQALGKDRILVDADAVIARRPDIIFGSWCGKKFRPERVAERPGWSRIAAVQNGDLYEIKSSIILQPGPAALTDGLAELARIIRNWAGRAS
jgi:iron complex transport system substrate-binding protein